MVKMRATGTKKAKKPATPMEPFQFAPLTTEELSMAALKYVRCRIQSSALPNLNFEWPAITLDLTVGQVKEAVFKRHGGSVPGIRLYRHSMQPANLIDADDSAQLGDVGIDGIYYGSAPELPVVTIVYDFEVPCSDCPVVIVEPDAVPSKYKVPLKEFKRMDQQRAAAIR